MICDICDKVIEGDDFVKLPLNGDGDWRDYHIDCLQEAVEEIRYRHYLQCPNRCGKLEMKCHFDGQRDDVWCSKCHYSGVL